LSSQTTNTHHQPTPRGADQRGNSTCFGGTPCRRDPLGSASFAVQLPQRHTSRLSSSPLGGADRPVRPLARPVTFVRFAAER
jgi:hypothetical protein